MHIYPTINKHTSRSHNFKLLGRFLETLLGKRVDYSERSVIVVGPSVHVMSTPLRN